MNLHYALLLCVLCHVGAQQDELMVRRIMKDLAVVPDVLAEPPKELLKVRVIYSPSLSHPSLSNSLLGALRERSGNRGG